MHLQQSSKIFTLESEILSEHLPQMSHSLPSFSVMITLKGLAGILSFWLDANKVLTSSRNFSSSVQNKTKTKQKRKQKNLLIQQSPKFQDVK